jgi:hypothetical protein
MAEQLPNITPYILQSGEIRVISSLQEGTLLNFAESGFASANRMQPLRPLYASLSQRRH